MPKFVIERKIPAIGNSTPEQLRAASQSSCSALRTIGPEVQWVHSYVTEDTIYCVYLAPDEAAIQEHARLVGLPASRISRVSATIDPTTAE